MQLNVYNKISSSFVQVTLQFMSEHIGLGAAFMAANLFAFHHNLLVARATCLLAYIVQFKGFYHRTSHIRTIDPYGLSRLHGVGLFSTTFIFIYLVIYRLVINRILRTHQLTYSVG